MFSLPKKINNIDSYIASFPKNTQTILEKIRQVIKESAPAAKEAMKYGIPTFVLSENLVHFAGYKNHIGFYPTPTAISAFKKELSIYKQAKGSVQFPIDKPIPFAIIKKIVKFRVEEINKKQSENSSNENKLHAI
ncbi:MAG: iron chaperone [Patescibacteria group bacterium]